MGTCPLLSRPPHALLQTLPSRLSCAPSSNMSGPPWAASLWENAMLAYIPSRLAIAAITCAMAVPAFAHGGGGHAMGHGPGMAGGAFLPAQFDPQYRHHPHHPAPRTRGSRPPARAPRAPAPRQLNSRNAWAGLRWGRP